MPHQAYPALQERSSRSLEKILEATEALLAERDLSEISVRDIARRAGRSVGTVYTRLPDKDAILAHLFDRFASRSALGIQEMMARGRNEEWTLERRARTICRWIIDRYVEERGIVRALAHCLFYESRAVPDSFRRKMTKDTRDLAKFLVAGSRRILHDDPTAAGEFAIMSALALAQSRVVFGARSSIRLRFSRDELAKGMTHMMVSYLTNREARTSD